MIGSIFPIRHRGMPLFALFLGWPGRPSTRSTRARLASPFIERGNLVVVAQSRWVGGRSRLWLLTRRRGEAEEDAEDLRKSEIPVKGLGDCSPGDSLRAWGWRKRRTTATASAGNKGLASEFPARRGGWEETPGGAGV